MTWFPKAKNVTIGHSSRPLNLCECLFFCVCTTTKNRTANTFLNNKKKDTKRWRQNIKSHTSKSHLLPICCYNVPRPDGKLNRVRFSFVQLLYHQLCTHFTCQNLTVWISCHFLDCLDLWDCIIISASNRNNILLNNSIVRSLFFFFFWHFFFFYHNKLR